MEVKAADAQAGREGVDEACHPSLFGNDDGKIKIGGSGDDDEDGEGKKALFKTMHFFQNTMYGV